MSHSRNLSGSHFSISDQLPKSMQERRLCQLSDFKRLRNEKGNSKVKLIRDKLIVDGKLVDPCLEKNPVKPATAPLDSDDIQWAVTKEQSVDNSKFWGFSREINCIDDVQEGLAGILEDNENSQSTHIVYAYRFVENDNVTEGHADDGEIGASRVLIDELRKCNSNALVAILRNYGGRNLGAKRFRIYRDHAHVLLKGGPPSAILASLDSSSSNGVGK